ncbi:AraC family transcriptional regulator [Pedobacter frigidisoli]|uniref:AraC family transcriptional regulator n=1 Tax=Pedobacter frigidisoli TaxID=2530455 RepID=A0A4R0P1S7_9SPHI|nr:helix-turn-helix transcriptional regulator [Pedobacter frigidisoli]TCD10751.1 AraC family transcriptional regulator [Pedobacter frigidisoli]
MATTHFHKFKTISEFHKFRGLPKPEHPLISVINLADVHNMPEGKNNIVFDFYSIALKRNFNAKIRYGQQEYDFDEGIMFFISPGQIFRIEVEKANPLNHSGWMLLVHPDFLWNTPLAKIIKQCEFFDYSVHEALFLSDKEENTVATIMQNIQQEYHSNIDKFSQNVILAQLELLLTYSDRFYHRQFLTRKIANHTILDRIESMLEKYFENDQPTKGLPTVQYIAQTLNMSPNYLSGLLKVLTGQSTQQHIHDKLIEKAKEKLSITNLSVSEIAYELGFEHPQSFSKLFKTKTNLSPLAFRASFN